MSGAAKYLANLPSRGLFSSTVLSSNPGGMRVYICDHDTSPPEDQLIKTNQANILIRSLSLKKQKNGSPSKDTKIKQTTEITRGKRSADRTPDGKMSSKRANLKGSEASSSHLSDQGYQSLTVERLRALLRGRGLPTRGKKEELIARLKSESEEGKEG